jgi:hypothetical protein
MGVTLGAGHKNLDNSFTGVLMGDIQYNNTSIKRTGLYGFNNGINTFGLDAETGEGYFKGRVEASSGFFGMWSIKENTFVIEGEEQDGPIRLGWISPIPL